MKNDSISIQELEIVKNRLKVDTKKLFNTAGVVYKEMDLKSKIDSLSDLELFNLIHENGLLLKRPLIIDKEFILLGNNLAQLESYIGEL